MYKTDSIENKPSNVNTVEHTSEINIQPEDKFVKNSTEQQLESILNTFLKYGVLIANGIVSIGAILYLIDHGDEISEYQVFQGTPAELRSPISIFETVLSGDSRGIIQLGILVLVSIPIIRVIISFITFLWKRELVYVVITGLVLCSLGYSLIAGF
ncbi:MAG: DUF1634 domain-containing protein [Sphaerospermopsis sp. SIO1G2]|nr:DUF1634 domain-containing protein [Sphaerospermopsis sp. SIO1G1]NET69636.1 DUF1634 domain-containing protein [Sphaerospermopsis sp. SIO1G2]